MYRALVSFSGIVSMAMGEVREIPDSSIADDLLRAGYIMKVEPEKPEKKETKPRRTKKGKSNV